MHVSQDHVKTVHDTISVLLEIPGSVVSKLVSDLNEEVKDTHIIHAKSSTYAASALCLLLTT